jgi:acetyl esterase/lipase
MTGKHLSQAILALALFLPALSCRAADSKTDNKEPRYIMKKNILYRDQPDVTDYMRERCRLDLYCPEGVDDFATVVWFHGGGLVAGNRYVPGELRKQGLAVAAASYRLSPEVKAPAYIEDAAAALAWVFRNIDRYGGSPRRIFVCGASAGGYLATMVVLDKRWLAPYDIDPDTVAGLVSLSGQAITHVAVRKERGISRMQPVIDDLAPLYHVRRGLPPTLLVTGDRELELLGRQEENAYFQRMLKLVGNSRVEQREIEGVDHLGLEAAAHKYLLEFVKRINAESPKIEEGKNER